MLNESGPGALELRRAGVSLREIASAVGVSYDTVRRWTAESGPRPASEGVEGAGAVGSAETGAPALHGPPSSRKGPGRLHSLLRAGSHHGPDLGSVEGIAGELDRVYADVQAHGYSRAAMLRERLLRSRLDVLARLDVCKDHITLEELEKDRAWLHGIWVSQIRVVDRELQGHGVDAEDLLDRCLQRVMSHADAGEVLNDGK